MCPVEVSQRIEARPQRVWGLIADPTTMGEAHLESTLRRLKDRAET